MPASYVVDMDGVIYHGHRLIPGALDFVRRLSEGGPKFLFLTNNSQWTPRDLRYRLDQMGIQVEESALHISALATVDFLRHQRPGGTAYVIGGAGLTNALYGVGYTLTEHNPDYVVVGDTRSYDFEKVERAIRLVLAGARFIATNQHIAEGCGVRKTERLVGVRRDTGTRYSRVAGTQAKDVHDDLLALSPPHEGGPVG